MSVFSRKRLGAVVSSFFSGLLLSATASAQLPAGSVHEFVSSDNRGLNGLVVHYHPQAVARIETSEVDVGLVSNVIGVETIQQSGPSSNRIDLVFVGDGFSVAELPVYRALVAQHVEALFQMSPFREYRNFFNVHRVDIASDLSGVSLDPAVGGLGAAPSLGTTFSCYGNERLLCANEARVSAAASFAPQADQILVVANTGTYGGAGYFSSGIAVYSGRHELASEIMAHEMGHSFALLGDEYEVASIPAYFGPEVSFPNISIRNSQSMFFDKAKWFRWIGVFAENAGGRIDTFEGADFTPIGKFRPSLNSKMRSLGEPFNAPSQEAFIAKFYEHVRPIENFTPRNARVRRGRTLRVEPLGGENGDRRISWLVNGKVKRRGVKRFRPDLATKHGRANHVEVRVGDTTSRVRDPEILKTLMVGSRSWVLR